MASPTGANSSTSEEFQEENSIMVGNKANSNQSKRKVNIVQNDPFNREEQLSHVLSGMGQDQEEPNEHPVEEVNANQQLVQLLQGLGAQMERMNGILQQMVGERNALHSTCRPGTNQVVGEGSALHSTRRPGTNQVVGEGSALHSSRRPCAAQREKMLPSILHDNHRPFLASKLKPANDVTKRIEDECSVPSSSESDESISRLMTKGRYKNSRQSFHHTVKHRAENDYNDLGRRTFSKRSMKPRQDIYDYGEESELEVEDVLYDDQFLELPAPWNVRPRRRGHKDNINTLQALNKCNIKTFDGKSYEDYARWRSQIISWVHSANCDIVTKVTLMSALLSDPVKDHLEVSIDLTPLSYFELINTLEAKYGGTRRLLRAALAGVKALEPLKPERMADVEQYIRMVETLFRRLREAQMEGEISTLSTFLDVTASWPWTYRREFMQWSEQNDRPESAEEALVWARGKLHTLRNLQQLHGAGGQIGLPSTTQSRSIACFAEEQQAKSPSAIVPGQRQQLAHSEVEENLPKEYEDETHCLLGREFNYGKPASDCWFCQNEKHRLLACPTFLDLPIPARRNFRNRLKLCFMCALPGHIAANCRSGMVCEKCKGGHNAVLHQDEIAASVKVPRARQEPESNQSFAFKISDTKPKKKLGLKAVTIKLRNTKNGREVRANALLDSANEMNLISEACANGLGLKGYPLPIHLDGVAGCSTSCTTLMTEVRVENLESKLGHTIPVRVIKDPAGDYKLTDWFRLKEKFPFMSDIKLVPLEGQGKVDIIIGVKSPFLLTHLEEIMGNDNRTVCVRTPLGWAVFGRTDGQQLEPPDRLHTFFCRDQPMSGKQPWLESHTLEFKPACTQAKFDTQKRSMVSTLGDAAKPFAQREEVSNVSASGVLCIPNVDLADPFLKVGSKNGGSAHGVLRIPNVDPARHRLDHVGGLAVITSYPIASDEEFSTIVTTIGAILNHRPLTYLDKRGAALEPLPVTVSNFIGVTVLDDEKNDRGTYSIDRVVSLDVSADGKSRSLEIVVARRVLRRPLHEVTFLQCN